MGKIKNESYKHVENHVINHIRLINSSGEGYDITELMQNLNLLESIFRGFITGSLYFTDTFGIVDGLELLGDDIVQIDFTTKDENYVVIENNFSKTFSISSYTKITDKENSDRNAIRLDLISTTEYEDEKFKISRSFNNMSSSQFVNYALDLLDYNDDRNIEDTLHTRDFIVPNISPLQMVEFFTRNSQSKENSSGDYYFFENIDGINFITSHTMINSEPVAKLYKKPTTSIQDYNRILDYQRTKAYDIPDQYRHGGYGMRVISSDTFNKRFTDEEYTVEDVKSESGYLNTALYGEEKEQTFSHVQHYPMNGFYENISKSQVGHFAPFRTINRTMLMARIADLTIAGNVEIKSGSVVDIVIPDKNNKINTTESGKAVVVQIEHNMSRTKYTQKLKVASDSVRF